MKVDQVLHMVVGAGETSYATNSRLQEKAILRTKHLVEEAITEVYTATLPEKLVIADLGCGSGSNTLLVISQIIRVIGGHCHQLGHESPEIQCFLNDLPGNDFNTMFRYSTMLLKEQEMKEKKGDEQVPYCYVAGVSGSFYGRLFPNRSVHFFHSSYSLMWLSQVPQGLESTGSGATVNKGNIYISTTSPSFVIKSYMEQFKTDFSTFLSSRFKELKFGGRMVLAFLGRKILHAPNGELSCLYGLLSDALNAQVLEGMLHEEEVDKFNLPIYSPSLDEVKAVIENEASFCLDQVDIFESNWDPFDDSSNDIVLDSTKSGKNVASSLRAVFEPIFAQHFGVAFMDDLFSKFATNVAKHLQKEKTKYVVFVISLKKKQ